MLDLSVAKPDLIPASPLICPGTLRVNPEHYWLWPSFIPSPRPTATTKKKDFYFRLFHHLLNVNSVREMAAENPGLYWISSSIDEEIGRASCRRPFQSSRRV